uniref:Activator of Hsp90 ATPase homologue 1/2-like C-terminal domain-containing protein n=1 Tax=Thermosporothrix sp. COM3 TaxID=2490863 RepID=A0A455SKE3_9CHLR|nr:hypothetical protein KTC_21800 [Thermosporothrix sp. COM3]
MTETRNTKWIKASPETLYQAFTDPTSLPHWFAPEGMTAEVHSFDYRIGGGYQMSLYYPSTEPTPRGKTKGNEDRYTARFVELTPPHRIVTAIIFDTTNPDLAEEMFMEVTFTPEQDGTTVSITFTHIPPGIRPEDNEEGTHSTLERLARFVTSA